MGARTRLNSVFIAVAFIMAAMCGAASQSWGVFILVLAVVLGLFLHDGVIRPSPKGRHRRR